MVPLSFVRIISARSPLHLKTVYGYESDQNRGGVGKHRTEVDL